MKLVYLAPIGLFDDWAHTVQIMKMCEAFSQAGAEVELVVPNRKVSFSKSDTTAADPFKYNNVKEVFKITKLPAIDLFYGSPSKFFYWLRLISFLVSSRFYLAFKKYDILYTREVYSRLFFSNLYLEKHTFPKIVSYFNKFVFKSVKGLVVLTSFIKKGMIDLGVGADKVLVSHDGVRLEDFSITISKDDARRDLSLSSKDYIFGYIGTLKTMGMEKGVGDAISALKYLPNNYRLYVVGGTKVDVSFYESFSISVGVRARVTFAGTVLHKSIPIHISACDIVVAPFPKNEHYEYYMSPLKIFEYMASKRPMVVTNLASLREVLRDKETALFIEPNNPKQLASAVEELVNNPDLAEKISQNAYLDMEQNYTWNKRAENIIEFIKK